VQEAAVTDTATRENETPVGTQHVDVLIVGAGISGIGAAYHLTTQRPGTTFVVLEALESFGGTWLIHNYPGTRSDSDLYTFGYRFKPWTGAPIATREEIRTYLDDVIEDNGLAQHIRYRHRITSASWSSEDALWTLEVTRTDTGEQLTFTTRFLWMCQGYYRHAEGYTPQWPGMERYQGRLVHPQTWPEDLDCRAQRVVVIGSGATAATLVPAIADDAEHVTVLQRSPTYFFCGRNVNELADTLRELEIPEEWTHEIVRRKILQEQRAITQLSFEAPEMVKDELLRAVRDLLPEGYDVDTHFTPRYRPWQQRLAFVPDGDLFAGIRSGKASMVTDEIETFTETGITTKSGDHIDADIVITATGFNLSVMGDIPFVVDGRPVDFSETVTYRGMMCTGVPNMAWIFGYFRASWTLRVDLVADFVCRLLAHMEELGATKVTPQLRPEDADAPLLPWVDPENFNPNYLLRQGDLLPKRLDKPEWQHTQDYWVEKDVLPAADLDDGCLRFE
jgi:cation diffusion facilitator CzcD-associated flavoprotein CzcO